MADFLIKAGANIELGASTPLMESAQEGHIELTKYLLQNGADVNAQSGTGDTALTYACENGHTDVSDLLLKYNAVLVRTHILYNIIVSIFFTDFFVHGIFNFKKKFRSTSLKEEEPLL